MGISYLDCNTSIGAHSVGVYQPCLTVDELLREMDWVGVDQALVHHALMGEQSPVVGNAALAEAIVDQPRLVGSWAILPPQTGELPQGRAFFSAMEAAGARALWALPRRHRYVLDRVTFGTLLDQVSERCIPLFLPRNAGGDNPGDTWELVYRLLSQYPQLTLVVTAVGPWGEDRYFRPLIETFPRFFLDTSRYELDCGLREFVAKYGPERLLYGSNFPHTGMGGSRLMLAHAGLTEEARQAIAGGNARRLLSEVELS